jgi:hypothetical protein
MRFCFAGMACLFVCVNLTGCVNRRMTIRSNPSGALVEIDGERIGLTPVSMDFTYYGTREFTISAPGYESLTVLQPVPAPPGQRFPLDFFTNHFMPRKVTDRHDFTYNLMRRNAPIDEESDLINRARDFRSQAEVGGTGQP